MKATSTFIILFLVVAIEAYSQPIPKYTYEVAVKYEFQPNGDELTSSQPRGQKKILNSRPLAHRKDPKRTSILDNIRILEVSSSQNPAEIADSLKKLPGVVYAEPLVQEQLLAIPNDPQAAPGNAQRYLQQIDAYGAWDITKSNSGIIIGIIDTGTDLDHEDIQGNLYVNQSDPVNGIDDDNNGYIDDYIGYDFADTDGSAEADGNPHGTKVGGVAAAQTNNNLGIAGVGYNAKWSPLKIFTSSLTASAGSYQSIIYAADNDYDIVNLSWGSVDTFSQFRQDIINYAVLEKNVVVVAAAGNTPQEVFFYPASYDNVLSIAASDFNDIKAGFSTFNEKVDLIAPGIGIYSTDNSNSYGNDNGTSYAAPQVAGVAALVKDAFPNLTATQIMERIRATTDPIYDIPGNEAYEGKLGTGRLNAFKAVSEREVYSARIKNLRVEGPFGSDYYYGDTLQISVELENYLNAVINPVYELRTSSPYIKIIKGKIEGAFINTMKTRNIGSFTIKLSDNTPAETLLQLFLDIQYNENHHSTELISFESASNRLLLDSDQISVLVEGQGDLGRNEAIDSAGSELKWAGETFTRHLGIAIRANQTTSDNLPDTWLGSSTTSDFLPLTPIKPAPVDDFFQRTENQFLTSDSSILIRQQGVVMEQSDSAILLSYEIFNISADTIFDFRMGNYTDWQVLGVDENMLRRVSKDVISASSDGLFAGVKLFGADAVFFHPINVTAENSLFGTITDSKINSLLLDNGIDSLGFTSPTDVGSMLGFQIGSLAPGKIYRAGFGFGAALDEEKLINILNKLDSAFTSNANLPGKSDLLFSCQGGEVSIDLGENNAYFFSDPLATDTLAFGNSLKVGPLSSDTVIYRSIVDSLASTLVQSIEIRLLENIADFAVDPDTLFLGDKPINRVSFRDQSLLPTSWKWDFGNGKTATGIENPISTYESPGSYNVSLIVDNQQGCQDTTTKSLVVISRPAEPDIPDRRICPGDILLFQSSNVLRIYATNQMTTLIQEGNSLSIPGIDRDTVFYISQLIDNIESRKKEVKIDLADVSVNLALRNNPEVPDPFALQLYLNDTSYHVREWDILGTKYENLDTIKIQGQFGTLSAGFTALSDEGCEVSKFQEFELEASEAVELPPTVVSCPDSSTELTPASGELFGFYTDPELTNLLEKSANLMYGNIEDTTDIFVVNLSSLLPGPILQVGLIPERLNPRIVVNPEKLYLSEGFSASFSVDTVARTINWFSEGEEQSTDLEPVLFFDSAGLYEVAAQIVSGEQCIYTDTLLYEVISERPLSIGEDKLLKRPYPNPSTGKIRFSSGEIIRKIKVVDLSGKLIYESEHHSTEGSLEIDKQGIFFLQLYDEAGKEVSIDKIVIQFD